MIEKTLNEVVFSDIPLDFEVHPLTNNLIPLKNERAIKQSVRNLVLTNFYENPYNGLLGSNILSSLFENYSPLVGSQIKKDIEQVIVNNEPRVTIVEIILDADIDYNGIKITIIFTCVNSLIPISVELLLDRVR